MKRRLKKPLLFSIVVFLFVFSLYKTCDLLNISFHHDTINLEQDIKEESNTSNNIKQQYNINTFQTEDMGQVVYDGTYIYYNNEEYLIKRDKTTGEETPISTTTKNLAYSDDYIFGTQTYANGNDILMDYIVQISKFGDEKQIFYKTECSYITSVCYDGKYIYYTNESHNIYRLNTATNESEIFVKDNEKNDYPIILGILNSNIYYIDDSYIFEYNLINNEKRVVSTQGCSYLQKPIIYNNYIYMFGNFNNNNIVRIDILTGNQETIIDTNYLKNKTNHHQIDSFNIIGGYIFINVDKDLYYMKVTDTFGLEYYKTITSSNILVTDDSLFFIDNGIEEIFVNWLISK